MNFKTTLIILLVFVVLHSLLWMFLIPIWHGPDEQAHFAQLQYYNEKRTLNISYDKNLSEQVFLSEEILGTKRDPLGNNKFTYHPNYNIKYSFGAVGPYENVINNQSFSARSNMVSVEAPHYPPLYYLLASPFYQLSGVDNNLIEMVFSVRYLSVFLQAILFFIAFKIGVEVWGDNRMGLGLAGLVTFQPMISFLFATFHPDNLLNVIYSASLLICILILKHGLKIKYIVGLGLLFFLGIETKELMLLFVPVGAATIAFKFMSGKRFALITPTLLLLVPAIALLLPVQIPLPFAPRVSPIDWTSFVEYLRFRVPKIIFEIWPWYWGVFKWLGLTLPPLVMKVITRVFIGGIFLATFKLMLKILNHQFDLEFKVATLFIVSAVSFGVYLILWDYRIMQNIGFSQGIQGRYFFPNIVGHMFLLIFGYFSLIPRFANHLRKLIIILLFCGMFGLNSIAWLTVASSYYNTSSIRGFVIQFSQYKPQIVKEFVKLLT